MSKAINTKDEYFICASQTKDAPVIRTALLRGWRGLKMTFFLSYHMFIFKIKSLLYALKRAQALSFSLFFKTSCLFCKESLVKSYINWRQICRDCPSDSFTSLQPLLWYCAPQHRSPRQPTVVVRGREDAQEEDGRVTALPRSGSQVLLHLESGSLEARGGSLYILCWVWEWTLALREWAVSKWLFFGNLTSPISSIQNLRYMFPVICKTKQWSLQTLEEYVEFLIKWSQVGMFFILLVLVFWKKKIFFNFFKSTGSLKCKHF